MRKKLNVNRLIQDTVWILITNFILGNALFYIIGFFVNNGFSNFSLDFSAYREYYTIGVGVGLFVVFAAFIKRINVIVPAITNPRGRYEYGYIEPEPIQKTNSKGNPVSAKSNDNSLFIDGLKSNRNKWIFIVIVVSIISFISTTLINMAKDNPSMFGSDGVLTGDDFPSLTDDDDEYVTTVKNGNIQGYPEILIKDSFNNYFTDTRWISYESADGMIVEFNGIATNDTEEGQSWNIHFEFLPDSTNAFYIKYITTGGVTYQGNDLMIPELLTTIFDSDAASDDVVSEDTETQTEPSMGIDYDVNQIDIMSAQKMIEDVHQSVLGTGHPLMLEYFMLTEIEGNQYYVFWQIDIAGEKTNDQYVVDAETGEIFVYSLAWDRFITIDEYMGAIASFKDPWTGESTAVNDTVFMTVIADPSLNMRLEASANSGIVDSIPYGTVLEVYDIIEGWAFISYTIDGIPIRGYVRSEYLE